MRATGIKNEGGIWWQSEALTCNRTTFYFSMIYQKTRGMHEEVNKLPEILQNAEKIPNNLYIHILIQLFILLYTACSHTRNWFHAFYTLWFWNFIHNAMIWIVPLQPKYPQKQFFPFFPFSLLVSSLSPPPDALLSPTSFLFPLLLFLCLLFFPSLLFNIAGNHIQTLPHSRQGFCFLPLVIPSHCP